MLIVIGHETTAGTISFAVPLLAIHSEVQEWVRDEVDAVMGNATGQPVYQDTFPRLVRCLATMVLFLKSPKRSFTDCAKYETLRLFSVISMQLRYSGNETQVLRIKDKELKVPPHTYVTANYNALFWNPDLWGDDVAQFRPDRWIKEAGKPGDEAFNSSPGLVEFVAWAIGPRVCPGKKFSQVEFVAVLASVLGRYRVNALEGPGEDSKAAQARLMRTILESQAFLAPIPTDQDGFGLTFMKR